MRLKTTSFKLGPDTLDLLQRLTDHLQMESKTEVIRLALRQMGLRELGRDPAPTGQKKNGKK